MALNKIISKGDVLPIPEYVNHNSITTAENLTIPSGAGVLVLVVNAAAYINTTGTAVVPSSDVTDGSGSFLIAPNTPYRFLLAKADGTVPTISIIAATGTVLATQAYYKN